jgi:hypothetical protein
MAVEKSHGIAAIYSQTNSRPEYISRSGNLHALWPSAVQFHGDFKEADLRALRPTCSTRGAAYSPGRLRSSYQRPEKADSIGSALFFVIHSPQGPKGRSKKLDPIERDKNRKD